MDYSNKKHFLRNFIKLNMYKANENDNGDFFHLKIIFFNENLKVYIPLTVFTKYWLYSPCCTIHPCRLLPPTPPPRCGPHLPPQG